MPDEHTARLVHELHEAVRRAQAAGDHEDARAKLRAIQALDPGNALAESLLDGSARHCQMTLMFCDLVGSTALAERLDPEDMSEVLRAYRTVCAGVVERYEGFIEDRQGDGLLVRFGPPRVHEDDPRRAVLTALGIVDALRDRSAEIQRRHGVELAVRIAVHTGMALIEAGDIIGPLPNEAARLQGLAAPGTVRISDSTWALVRGYFDVEAHGPATLRGVSRPVETFTVRGERASAPLEAMTRLTPFVGRERESAVIAELWQRAVGGGSPPAVLVTGGPGIGKSRLLMESARALGASFRLCQCSGYHTTTSLHAFGRLLSELCAITDEDGPQERLEKLRAAAGREPGDLPLLAAALSVPLELTSPPAMDAAALRLRAIEVAAGIIQARLRRPSVLLVEDLQWADDSSLDLVGALLLRAPPGLLIALSARVGFVARWPEQRLRRVHLGPLSAEETRTLALEIPESAVLPDDQRGALVARSDGVPLYLEELARGADALAWDPARPSALGNPGDEIPAALRDPLLARLSTPGVDLELVQLAATIGRDVDRRLLQQAAGLDDHAFHAKLTNLLALGLIDRSSEDTIRFRHELIRAVAYDTQRRTARRARHSRIADLLPVAASRGGDAGAAAFHLERAERYEEAIDAHVRAAAVGQALGAHQEVTRQLAHVLELVECLPEGTSRLERELAIRQLRGFSSVMSGGYSTRECREDNARCVELCEILGPRPELLPSLLASWSYYCSCDLVEIERVRQTIRRQVAGGALEVPLRTLDAGITAFFEGRLGQARELLPAFLDQPWGHAEGAPPPEWLLPHDPYAAASAHLVATLAMVDEPERARAVFERGLQRAAGLQFPFGPFSAAYVHSQLAFIRRLEGDLQGAAESGAQMRAIGRKHGFALFTVAGEIHQALSRVHAGEFDALDVAATGVAQWRALLAAEIWCPFLLAELAAAQALAGRRADALASLEQALATADSTGAQFYTSEVLRLRGELRLQDGDPRGLADLREGYDLARRQGAVVLAARAEASLQAAHALPST